MKKSLEILWRLTKVIYVLLLLLGLIAGLFAWSVSSPYTEYSYDNYHVQCDNGKSFDPKSKPIYSTPGFNSPDSFYNAEVKSECHYGTAYYVGSANELPDKYTVSYKTYPHVIRTASDQMVATVITLIVYYLLLEIVRRIVLYIFQGRNFLTLKKKDHHN